MTSVYEVKNKRNTALEKMVKAKDIIGKDVIARNGMKVGEIDSLEIDPENVSIQGIMVHKGIFKDDEFIEKNQIESITNDGATLKITPMGDVVGLKVHDSTGKVVGDVKETRMNKRTGSMTSIVVHRGILKKDRIFSSKEIKEVSGKVVLNREVLK